MVGAYTYLNITRARKIHSNIFRFKKTENWYCKTYLYALTFKITTKKGKSKREKKSLFSAHITNLLRTIVWHFNKPSRCISCRNDIMRNPYWLYCIQKVSLNNIITFNLNLVISRSYSLVQNKWAACNWTNKLWILERDTCSWSLLDLVSSQYTLKESSFLITNNANTPKEHTHID